MSLVDPLFPLFVALALAAAWLLPQRHRAVRLLASLLFYAWSGLGMLAFLLASSAISYGLIRLIARDPGRRRWWTGAAIAVNLAPLALLKYLDFTVLQLQPLFPSLSPPGWVIPLGLSFWTFQALGWVLDTARGTSPPPRDGIEYLLFVSWFPQLVAGPIERSRALVPQLARWAPPDRAGFRAGIALALSGAAKKVVVADTLGPYVDKVFARADPPAVLVGVAGVAFMVQIYADFSGYTDIARGVSQLFGVRLSENFRAPWLAASPLEFWSRWHITMTTWIRDYLLGPLLGAGVPSAARQSVVVVVALLLLGAWHGAGWNYLAFGLWHAGWILLYSRLPRPPERGRARAGWVAFHLVALGWVGGLLFREPDPLHLWRLLTSDMAFAAPDRVAAATLAGLALVGAGSIALVERADQMIRRVGDLDLERPIRATWWAALAAAVILFGRELGSDFLYFRF